MQDPPDRSTSPLRAAAGLLVIAAIAVSFAAVDFAAAQDRPAPPPDAESPPPTRTDAGTAGPDAGRSPDTTPDAGGSVPPGGRPSPSADRLLDEAGAIAEQVARIRGLPVLEPIDKGVKRRDELRKLLVDKLEEEQSKRRMRREAALLRKLGLIPEQLNYRKTVLDVLTEQIAGFYDQKADELNIMVGLPLDLQRPAMAHEIFHAIQDQHFDLTRLTRPFSTREHGDFHLARSALVEGDATVLMMDYSLYRDGTLPRGDVRSIVDIPMMANMLEQLEYGQLGALEKIGQQPGGAAGPNQKDSSSKDNPPSATALSSSALSEAPPIVRRVLIFPYLAGMRFVIELRAQSNWQEFDNIYDRPPVSTEQILHPDRYRAGDEPLILRYRPGPVLDSYDRIYDTVFGEFQMRLFLQHHADDSGGGGGRTIDPVEATTGWDGDRLFAFRGDDDRVIVTHVSVWDTTRDAVEYYNALVETQRRRFAKSTSHTSSGEHGASTCMHVSESGARQRVYVERWGDLVLHIEGAPTRVRGGDETDPTTYLLREQIWRTLERTPFRTVYRRRMSESDRSPDE